MSPVRMSVVMIAILAIAVVTASAQPIISAKSGVIAGVEGKVFLDDQVIEQSVTHFPDMKENSVLRTEEGRAEILLPPGFVLRLGENGSMKMLTNRLIDTRLELQAGSAVLEVDAVTPDTNVTLAVKDGMVTISKAGVYRFDSEPARVKVFHGIANVQVGDQSFIVSTGKVLGLVGGAANVEKFDMEDTDALDHWSRRRGEEMAVANVSAAKYVNDNYGPLTTSAWGYNPYFGLYTFIPMTGQMCNSFYGYCYWSPPVAYRMFYSQPFYNYGGGSYGGGSKGTYNNAGTIAYRGAGTSPSGTSGLGAGAGSRTMGSSGVSMSSAGSAGSRGAPSSGASSMGASSAGHGSAASGGHGK